jgi:hypothetical protein
MSQTDLERNTTYANYPSRDEIGSVPDADYELKAGQFMDALGVPTEKKLILMATSTYSESACAYTCKINGVRILSTTPSSIEAEAQELSPTSVSATGYQFSINGGATWVDANPLTRNTYTFTGLNPDTEYKVEAREKSYGQCRFFTMARTTPAIYANLTLDTNSSARLNEVATIFINNDRFDAPFTNTTILNRPYIVGTPVNVTITPTIDTATGDFGWGATTVASITANGEEVVKGTGNTGTFASIGLTYIPQAGKDYKLEIN